MDISVNCIIILFFIGFVIFMLLARREIANSKKKFIRAEIHRQGGEVIEISYNFFSGSKGTYSYRVVFGDQFGNKYRTTCIILSNGNTMFWSQTPAELLGGAQVANALTNEVGNEYAGPVVNSSKEQLIDDLHEENLRLKEELDRLRNNGGSIS